MQWNIVERISKDLNLNLMPSEMLYDLSVNRFSCLDVQVPKTGKASRYVVPFFLEILDLKDSSLTRSIACSVNELDDLAIQIDSLIDTRRSPFTSGASIEMFDGLENKVVKCFSSLSGAANLDQLIALTLVYVNASFKLNTCERHLIYNFEKGVSYSRCTTMYLLPLIKYLGAMSERSFEAERIFILISNYIQLLDDFLDVFFDLNAGIATPVTERFAKIKYNLLFERDFESSFRDLVYDIKKKLGEYLKTIEQEINKMPGRNNTNDFFRAWQKFHFNFAIIPVPSANDDFEQQGYLQKIYDLTPPMLCYTG